MLENREGQRVPNVTFRTRTDNDWQDVTSNDLFRGKTVILFAVPGAYTPTCSSSHLPRYNELAPVFKANGVDEIVCLAVNDAFVMREWGMQQHAEHIRLIPDGNGEFSEAMGMLVDKGELGFGKRSWRYSMLVRDGIIEKMFIEPQEPGDPFYVSDAETMLHYINRDAVAPDPVTIITRAGCPHCDRARALLDKHGIGFEEVELGNGITSRGLRGIAGSGSVPQVFMDGRLIGTADALEAYLARASAA